MSLKTRLSKLEKTKHQITAEADCICFPPDEPPLLELRAEREAAEAVLCPVHGRRFSKLAPTIYRAISLPGHLDSEWRRWRSAQYIKAMDASFPPDRWPATKIVEPDGTVRFVLKNGTEIHRLDAPLQILEYPLENPMQVTSIISGRRDWEQRS